MSTPELANMRSFSLGAAATKALQDLRTNYVYDRTLVRLESSDPVQVSKYLMQQERIDASIELIDYLLESSYQASNSSEEN